MGGFSDIFGGFSIVWWRSCIRSAMIVILLVNLFLERGRPAQIAELPRSKFDPELFPNSAYVEIFVTFATKVPYLTIKRGRKWREN